MSLEAAPYPCWEIPGVPRLLSAGRQGTLHLRAGADPAPRPKALGCSAEEAEQGVRRPVGAVRMLLPSGNAACPARARNPCTACCGGSSRRDRGSSAASVWGHGGRPGPPGRALRARVSVLYFANKYHLFYLPGQAVALRAPACQGRVCMLGAAVHGPCHRGDVRPSQVVGVPHGWVGGAGRRGQAGMCWQGPCLLLRRSCGPKQRGPCWCTGRAAFPAPRGAVMWLRCRPRQAGGFLPCPGAWVGSWDLPVAPLLCIVFQHPKTSPMCLSTPTLSPPPLLGPRFVGVPCLLQQVGMGTVLSCHLCQWFVWFRSLAVSPQPAPKGLCGCPVSPGCPPAWRQRSRS